MTPLFSAHGVQLFPVHSCTEQLHSVQCLSAACIALSSPKRLCSGVLLTSSFSFGTQISVVCEGTRMLYHGLTDNRRHSGALRMHARAHASRKVTSAKGLCVVSSCGLSSIFALVSVLFRFLAFFFSLNLCFTAHSAWCARVVSGCVVLC